MQIKTDINRLTARNMYETTNFSAISGSTSVGDTAGDSRLTTIDIVHPIDSNGNIATDQVERAELSGGYWFR